MNIVTTYVDHLISRENFGRFHYDEWVKYLGNARWCQKKALVCKIEHQVTNFTQEDLKWFDNYFDKEESLMRISDWIEYQKPGNLFLF